MRFLCSQSSVKSIQSMQQMFEMVKKSHKILTATDLTALISFLLSKFFSILLISVKGRLLLYLMSLLQIPVKKQRSEQK